MNGSVCVVSPSRQCACERTLFSGRIVVHKLSGAPPSFFLFDFLPPVTILETPHSVPRYRRLK